MKKFIKNIALLFLVILFTGFSLQLAAQKTGGIKGFIHNQETGEPVLFANVFLMGTTLGSVSNDDGYFIITEVPIGVYTLRATYVGFDSVVRMIEIKEGAIGNIHIDLAPRKDILGKFTLEGDRTTDLTETKTSVIKVTPKQIDRIPSIGGQSDIAQFLQVVPGIVSTGDQGGQLYIRGGSPIQNKVLLDGMVIYNPFHSIGLFSVFDNEIIQTADIYTGGFNAEYGGRISSVMDIRTRDGNKRTLAGNANISTFGAKVMLEGPLRKSRDIDKSNTSFILSAKHSYLEEASNLLYEYVSDNGLPFNYTDLYGKMSINSDNGSKVNFFGFNFNDRVSYEALSDYQWNSYGIGTNFIAIPASSPMLIKGNFAFSNYFTSVEDESSTPKSSEITGFNMGLHFTNVKGNNNNSYGIEILGFKTNFQITNIANRVIDQVENTTEMAFYYKY
ncbi:MAG: TonB-dependent receptor, partial [Bacteroidales bacterium]|nr:TonB-dependent receptor [Bacteroidales bacterium]